MFNPEKLLWLNSHYIVHMEPAGIIKCLRPFLIREGLITEETSIDEPWMGKVITALKERCRTLVEMANAARYFFLEEVEFDEQAAAKFLVPQNKEILEALLQGIEGLTELTQENIDRLFRSIMEARGLKMGPVAQPLRVALTGRTVSPGIFEVIDILGKDRVTRRLRTAIARIPEQN